MTTEGESVTDDRIRVGVVGLGAVARAVHLPILTRRTDAFAIAGVCDLEPRVCEAVGERFGIPPAARFDDLDALLDGAALDALLVLASGSHAHAVVAALERGLAVFCEKPLAYTLQEAREIGDALGDRPERLMVGYMKAYDPAVVQARTVVAERPRPRLAEVNVFHPSSEAQLAVSEAGPSPWPLSEADVDRLREQARRLERDALGEAASSLGDLYSKVLLGSLSHDLAVLRALGLGVGDVEHAERWESEDGRGSVAVTARSTDGARVYLRWHYLDRYPAYREEVRWHDEEGSVELTFPSPYLLHAPTVLRVSTPAPAGAHEQTYRSPVEAFEEELAAFHELVTKGTPPRDGLAEGHADVVTCQCIAARIAENEGIAVGGEAAGG